jgi:predicted Holliday junction resolvase-like endonuclease
MYRLKARLMTASELTRAACAIGFIILVLVLVHHYLIGMKYENDRLRREIEIKKAEKRGRELKHMPLDDLITRSNERRDKRRETDEG